MGKSDEARLRFRDERIHGLACSLKPLLPVATDNHMAGGSLMQPVRAAVVEPLALMCVAALGIFHVRRVGIAQQVEVVSGAVCLMRDE